MDIPAYPTPPATQDMDTATQAMDIQEYMANGPVRHERFYCLDDRLLDPVILQAENTLYRVSMHALIKGCYFFAHVFSIGSNDPREGTMDSYPIILPQTVKRVDFDIYLSYGVRYDSNPTQDTLIRSISLSRQWSIQHIYDYAKDHLQRQFSDGRIHPAIILGVAREHGIPDLVRPAIEALADPKLTFSSWSVDQTITAHVTVTDLGAIGRMKEKLLMARVALCTPPPTTHDEVACRPSLRSTCSTSWKSYWMSTIVPRLLGSEGKAEGALSQVREGITSTGWIDGMVDECREGTIAGVAGKPGWNAEGNIVEGAVAMLMVPERGMLTVDDL